MITGTRLYLEELAQAHICSKHSQKCLVVAWLHDAGWVIRCGGGHFTDQLQAIISPSEAYRRGYALPVEIKDRIEGRSAMIQGRGKEAREDLAAPLLPTREEREAQHPTGKMPRAPRLPAVYEASDGTLVQGELRLAAIEFARDVGLVPELGHVCLYHGKPWVTIDGWYYRLRLVYPKTEVVSRPMSLVERDDALVEKGIHAWIAEVYEEQGGKRLSVGHGYCEADEALLISRIRATDRETGLSISEEEKRRRVSFSPELRYAWRMAEKRAEEDAIRKAVPLGIEEKGKEE